MGDGGGLGGSLFGQGALPWAPPSSPRLPAQGGSYSVWGAQPFGQQGSSLNTIGGLGGSAWGAPAPLQGSLPQPAGGAEMGTASLPPPMAKPTTAQPAELPNTPPLGAAAVASSPAAAASPSSAEGGADGPHAVRCKGLPFSATLDSVMDFFDPLDIVDGGVHMKSSPQGLPCGECYVVFTTEEDCIAAAKRNRQVMGHRYVNIERVPASEFMAAFPNIGQGGQGGQPTADRNALPPCPAVTGCQTPDSAPTPPPEGSITPAAAGKSASGNGGSKSASLNGGQGGSHGTETGAAAGGAIVIKMRGLPYSATEQEIATFFTGLRISQGGVSLGRDASGRASGEAHVEFSSESDAQAAMLLNRQRIGSRYIELFRTKQPPNAARRAVTSAATDGANTSDCLRLRGMPFNSTEADVLSFFKGYSLLSGGVKLGPQVGQGTVRFSNAEEARRAIVSLNHGYMGNRYIELFYN